MIRFKFGSLLAFLIALSGALCLPSRADAECTAATIGNTYGFHHQGFAGNATPNPLKVSAYVPVAGVGETTFTATSDTGGTISGFQNLSFGGAQIQPTFTGTYTVNAPKCTGTITVVFQDGPGPLLDFVIVKGGEEITFLEKTPGVVLQGVMDKE